MPVITIINPKKSKSKAKPKAKPKAKAKPMAKPMAKPKAKPKAKAKIMAKPKAKTKAKTITKRTPRKNPYDYSASRNKRGNVLGVPVTGAVKNVLPLMLGALASKFAAKKFFDGGSEGDNWTWKNYLAGLAGGAGAAILVSGVIGAKKDTGQKVLEGALLLIAYKAFVNEVAPVNQYVESWFGADADNEFDLSEFENDGDIYDTEYELEEYDQYPQLVGSTTERLSAPTAAMGSTERLSTPTATMGGDSDLFFTS